MVTTMLGQADFWKFTVGDVGLLTALLAMLWRTSSLVTTVKKTIADFELLQKRVELMDHTGTTASSVALKISSELASVNARQISILTESQLKIEPKVATIMNDLDWIKRGLRKGDFKGISNE